MSRKPKDLIGQKFGKLVVKEYAGKIGKYPSWWVECKCGKTFTVPAYTLYRGDAVGCPFCQTGLAAVPLLWHGQRITILPQRTYVNLPIEYIGKLVKQLTNNSEVNALLIMLEPVPSEAIQELGSEYNDKPNKIDCSDCTGEKC